MLWNPRMETMPRAELQALQLRRLQEMMWRVYLRVPFYRRALDAAGVRPGGVQRLEDLTRLPFTRKADFRDNHPFGLFAVPRQEVARLHASSGTTGKLTVVGYTRADLAMWAEVCARCLGAAGAEPGDVFHNAAGYGLFTGGLGMHAGAERMGLTVVPASGGNTERQVLLLREFRPAVLHAVPSYALTLAEALAAQGVNPASLGLRAALLGAEPWTEAMRGPLEKGLHLKAMNNYGLSEVIGPGVACECIEAQDGAHIWEDHFLSEVVDPESGEPLPPGQVGELVFTTLTKEALPVLRYRTGDLASLRPGPCRCGRTMVRMSRVRGRTDDMLIVRGVNVFPSQVEAALVGLGELSPHYQLVVDRPGTLDTLEVRIEVSDDFVRAAGGRPAQAKTDDLEDGAGRHAAERAAERLHGILGIHAKVTLCAPGALPRSEGGKLKRVEDRRHLQA